jgi:endonuclease-3 related protein
MIKHSNSICEIYQILYAYYGPQGWWPLIGYEGKNLSKNGNTSGYHVEEYDFPRNNSELFEVCLGAILTQNTTFTSVVKSLHNLQALNALTPEAIKKMDIERLKLAIRPSGYYNQKSRYILEFITFFEALNGRTPTRESLLKVLGIGEETADSILLYAYNQEEFVIDAYTKRMLLSLGLIAEKATYKEVKKYMQESLQICISEKKECVRVYQEYHALIVNHAKIFYSRKPYGEGCMLKKSMMFTQSIWK